MTRAIQGKSYALLLAQSLDKLLRNVVRQNKSTLPYCYYKITFEEELMMFLWRVFCFNQKLLWEILLAGFGKDEKDNLRDTLCRFFLVRLDHYMNAIATPENIDTMHMQIYTILDLSGKCGRLLGNGLNMEFNPYIKLTAPIISKKVNGKIFNGTYGDKLLMQFNDIVSKYIEIPTFLLMI